MRRFAGICFLLALAACQDAVEPEVSPQLARAFGTEKVTICHKGNEITVGAPAVAAHIAHGDSEGPCTLAWDVMTGGWSYACGLDTDGAAYCWGNNDAGNLGDGTFTSRLIPAAVSGGLTFRSISGSYFGGTCGVTSTAAAYCWGRGGNTTPALVGGFAFQSITVGSSHQCGLTPGGVAYCWGDNTDGQLGDGTTTARSTPTVVARSLTFASIEASDWAFSGQGTTCGITTGGAAYCWGDNAQGQVGDGTTTQRLVPTAVAGGLFFQSISAAYQHTCGLTTGGTAVCWGVNSDGRLGDGTVTQRLTPTAVTGGLSFQSISAGGNFTCGITLANTAYCWGNNIAGTLGDGTTTDRLIPTQVTGGLAFKSLYAAIGFTCGVTTENVAYCWGWNNEGQLGNGFAAEAAHPTPMMVLNPL